MWVSSNRNLKLCAFALVSLLAFNGTVNAKCTNASGGKNITGASGDTLVLLPGGTAEYSTSSGCTLLAFSGIRDGKSVYTDDGQGRGLIVLVSASAFELSGKAK